MEFEMLKMIGSSSNRELCNDCISSNNETSKYAEDRERNSQNGKTQQLTEYQPSPASPTRYRNSVLKSYGIGSREPKGCSEFSFSEKETKSQEFQGHEDNERPSNKIHPDKGQKELKRRQYEQMVLIAYGVLPVQECFSVL